MHFTFVQQQLHIIANVVDDGEETRIPSHPIQEIGYFVCGESSHSCFVEVAWGNQIYVGCRLVLGISQS